MTWLRGFMTVSILLVLLWLLGFIERETLREIDWEADRRALDAREWADATRYGSPANTTIEMPDGTAWVYTDGTVRGSTGPCLGTVASAMTAAREGHHPVYPRMQPGDPRWVRLPDWEHPPRRALQDILDNRPGSLRSLLLRRPL